MKWTQYFFEISVVVLQNGQAFSIQWTGYNAYLTVSASLYGQTCGLCGTFNDRLDDDRHLRSGEINLDLDEFAAEWLIGEENPSESVTPANDYCVTYSQNKDWAVNHCRHIKGNL